jgi:hypothetical protein
MINAYNLAMSDIAHPPVIHCIQRKGRRILVNASDEIQVASVRVCPAGCGLFGLSQR